MDEARKLLQKHQNDKRLTQTIIAEDCLLPKNQSRQHPPQMTAAISTQQHPAGARQLVIAGSAGSRRCWAAPDQHHPPPRQG